MFCAHTGLKKCSNVLDISGLLPLFQPSICIGVCAHLSGPEEAQEMVLFQTKRVEEGWSQPGTPICFPFSLQQTLELSGCCY